MLKAIKIRLYPTSAQASMFDQHFGSCRFIYNAALEYKQILFKDHGIKTSKFDLVKQITDVKKDESFIWLNECKAEVLQNTMDSLDLAFKGFFKGGGFPKFKSKHKSNSSFTSKQTFKILENTDKLVFFGHKVKFKCSQRDSFDLRNLNIKRITYSKNKLNQYFASVLVEFSPEQFPVSANSVGIDLGLKHFLITSDGEFIDNPRFFRKSEKKLRKVQRVHSRRVKGSSNREKSRVKVNKVHTKITNQRKHFLHQISNHLISENQTVKIENLNVAGMIQNRKLSKSIQDVSWSKFTGMLEYKAKWHNRTVEKIDRFYPSSKTCSNCGNKKKDLQLKDRTYACIGCGNSMDRDLNAAKNILNFNRDESARINAPGQQAIATGRRKKIDNKILVEDVI